MKDLWKKIRLSSLACTSVTLKTFRDDLVILFALRKELLTLVKLPCIKDSNSLTTVEVKQALQKEGNNLDYVCCIAENSL